MKKEKRQQKQITTVLLVILAMVAWASIPLFDLEAKAGGVPILVRTANLTSPTGSIDPHGAAEFQLYSNGNRELEVEIEDVNNLPAGTSLTVTINNATVGQVTLDVDGRGRLKLRTEDGQAVPSVNDGNTVEVRSGLTVLVSGVFGGGGPGPTPTASPSPTGSPSTSPSPGVSPSPSPSPTGSPNETGFFAALTGPTINGVLPSGFAEFEVHSSRVELEIRVRQVNIPPGSMVNVFVDNSEVGSFSAASNGEGRLRLRSDNGQTVPTVVPGSTVHVRFGGTNILSGTFAGFTGPTPSPSPSPSSSPGPTPSPSPAQGRSFEAHLSIEGSVANGEFKVSLDTTETQATIFGEFHDLASNQTGARIETTTGTSVVIHAFGVVGSRSGNFAPVTIPVSPALVQQLRTGLWSAVVTSVSHPSGEIIGQFTPRSSSSDFDGDGQADVALFRPSTGTWFTLNNDGFTVTTLGSAEDKIISADYDGDGKTDRAVFRPSALGSTWEISRSSDGGITLESFGSAGDIPVRGDFDGDGRNDLAVFRPSNSTWYLRTGGNWSYKVVQFGAAGDIPIPADMDGDGKDDITVFRPATGQWFWLTSAVPSFNIAQFGQTGDIPIKGDFDGDGRDDVSVYRPSNGTWYTRSSVGGYRVRQFGIEGDVPVASRYDGDSITDLAVFRPSTGTWYFLRSSDNSFHIVNFGENGDIPAISQ